MSQYRRFKIPGVSYFFTVNLACRGERVLTDHIDVLRWAYSATMREQPVQCDAMVILPDHLHAVWTLPSGDADFSNRWRKIKARFSHGLGQRFCVSQSKSLKREVGVWQRRFWEHCIRDEEEFAGAITYCHMNPVKHGMVAAPSDWPFSTIHRDLGMGACRTERWADCPPYRARRVGNLPTFPYRPLRLLPPRCPARPAVLRPRDFTASSTASSITD